MSNTENSQSQSARRPPKVPKVGVYVPRHRRGTAEEPSATNESSDSKPSSNASSPQLNNSSSRFNRTNTNTAKDDSTKDPSSPRSGNSSNSEIQRRGRGKFMGPGGIAQGSGSGDREGNTRGHHRDNRGNGHGSSINNSGSAAPSSASSSPSSSSSSPSSTPQPRHPPRGRDFDATVLRRYSDDENRPNSTFSRSSSYNSSRSNNSNSGNITTSNASKSAGRGKPDRSEEGSWRRDVSKTTDAQDLEQRPDVAKTDEQVEQGLIVQLDHLQMNIESDQADGNDSPEEPEDWELAFQDSDEEGIPRIESPKSITSPVPHPAESLLSSSGTRPSKIGNWSEVANDDMYILELYGFSASIKTMHLTDMFAPYENRSGGFRIKWIDDTKALVIFESAAVARQAYIANLTSQIAKIKPYTGADKDTIRNAGKPSSGAYNGVRPAKTDSVARRLVQGALGLRVRRTPEQIAEEKALVQAAKEAREAQRQEQQRQRQTMDAMFDS
ncbi:R3H and coiled-coil domain-containing protein 1 [Mortierella polycephala]|uniref:R3H and coiled-coil domain-containing protein 1 n=1 Tax=Mortierella polycephala TaxID=41804 RepID=A0A9P6TXN5_9FUNG|nr:R3H and coiled-coil domain-containing protein 1 [Mortierella polycephala]